MDSAEIIFRYFPQLPENRRELFVEMGKFYRHKNELVNLISRKDMEHFYERHVLHSLAIAKIITFKPGTVLLDVGTGGGFPAVPLAVFFPECRFVAVDSIAKKINVVQEAAETLGLGNLQALHARAESIQLQCDFVLSRAVAPAAELISWTQKHISKSSKNSIPNGWLFLKGGDLEEELSVTKRPFEEMPIADFYQEPFFETKKVVYASLIK